MLGAKPAKAGFVTSIRVPSSALLGQLFIWGLMSSDTDCLDSERIFMDWFSSIRAHAARRNFDCVGLG